MQPQQSDDRSYHAQKCDNLFLKITRLALSAGNAVVKPLVVAELKRKLLGDTGVATQKLQISVWRQFIRRTSSRRKQSIGGKAVPLRGTYIAARQKGIDGHGSERLIMYKLQRRANYWCVVPFSSILTLTQAEDKLSILLEHGKTNLLPPRRIIFTTNHWSVCDSLLVALREIIGN